MSIKPTKGPFHFVTQTTPAAANPPRVAAVNATKRDPMEYAPMLHLVVRSIKTDPTQAGRILGMVANAAVAGGISMDSVTLRTRLAFGDSHTMIQALRMAGTDRLRSIFEQ